MNNRATRYLVAGIAWGGIVAFVMAFVVDNPPIDPNRLMTALTLWGVVLFWPTVLALHIRWLGNDKWKHSSTEAFFWLSLFLSPLMSLLAYA
jgi:hypothetical protein